MQLVRLTMAHTDAPPISMDLFVDQGGTVNDGLVTYGRWAELNGDDVWYFMLKPSRGRGEARLDFGATEGEPTSDHERFGWTNITSKRLFVGELATIRYMDEEYCCRITALKTLPEGGDFVAESAVV